MGITDKLQTVDTLQKLQDLQTAISNARSLRFSVFVGEDKFQDSITIVVTGFSPEISKKSRKQFLDQMGETIRKKIDDNTLISASIASIAADLKASIPGLKSDLQQLITYLTGLENG